VVLDADRPPQLAHGHRPPHGRDVGEKPRVVSEEPNRLLL
jgi:hypothetical protein